MGFESEYFGWALDYASQWKRGEILPGKKWAMIRNLRRHPDLPVDSRPFHKCRQTIHNEYPLKIVINSDSIK
jgi:hypothetical protein